MDPNEALKTIRKITPSLREWGEAEEWAVDPTSLTNHDADLLELADAFEALDQWLAKGGFLPADWAAGR